MQLSQWSTQKDYLPKGMHESQCLRCTRLLIRVRIFLLEEWGFNLFHAHNHEAVEWLSLIVIPEGGIVICDISPMRIIFSYNDELEDDLSLALLTCVKCINKCIKICTFAHRVKYGNYF